MNDLEKYNLTTEAIAEKLGYHPQYVRFMAGAGKLPAIKRGRAWRFCEAEVLDFLKDKTKTQIEGGANGSSEAGDMLR